MPASKADEILEPNRLSADVQNCTDHNPTVPYRPSRSGSRMTSLYAIGASLSWRSVVSKRDSDDGDRRQKQRRQTRLATQKRRRSRDTGGNRRIGQITIALPRCCSRANAGCQHVDEYDDRREYEKRCADRQRRFDQQVDDAAQSQYARNKVSDDRAARASHRSQGFAGREAGNQRNERPHPIRPQRRDKSARK